MATREDLVDWVHTAVEQSGGTATPAEVAKHIWSNHEDALRRSGDLFYTWQYDMRWAALKLRKLKRLRPADASDRGKWMLT